MTEQNQDQDQEYEKFCFICGELLTDEEIDSSVLADLICSECLGE